MEGYNTILRLNLKNEIQKEAYKFIMNRPNKKESISSYISNVIVAYEGTLDGPSTTIHKQVPVAPSIDFRAIEVTTGKVIVPVTTETAIQEYADNAAAVTAGLTIGTHYRTGDLLKIVH